MFDFTLDNVTGFLFAFIPALFSLGLVIYIFTSLPRNHLVDIFAILTLCGGLWQMGDAMARASSTQEMADFWDGFFSIGWIFVGAVCLHFSLLYSKLINPGTAHWLVAALYIPSFVFLSIYQSHYFEHEFTYYQFWGWVNSHNKSTIDIVVIYWISMLVICACGILFYYSYLIRRDKLLFSQSIIITAGLSIPTIAGLISQVVFPLAFKQPAVPVTSYFLTFLSLATLVALNRYKLFTLSELTSSELLLDELPVIVLGISDTGHITYINKFGSDQLKIKKKELRKIEYQKMIFHTLPEHEANFRLAYTSALKGQSVENIESSLVIGDKTISAMMSASPIINNKRIRGALLCIRDVTELKASIQQTLKNERSLQEAQKLSHIGSWELNIHTNDITWSDELYNIYELPPSIPANVETLSEFAHPEDSQNVKEQLELAIKNKQPVEFNYRILLNDGVIKYLNAKLQPVSGSYTRPSMLFGTVQDVTRQVEAESSLQQKNLQLRQSNANLEEFVFVASHDLKEPIRKIITFGNLIHYEELSKLSEKSKAYFQRMTSAAMRMQTMIDDLLSLSVITQDNAFANHSLQEIVDEVAQDLDLKIKEKKATIETENLPSVYINPKQFRQLFLNLISNSLKFAKKDVPPVITIKSKVLNAKEIEQLSLIKGTSYMKITFEDNGIGFENAYADKIFQMFQRLHGKVDYDGTGIGLAVCKKVVENHKGIIRASGELNKGATFTIIIPIVRKNKMAAMEV
jgi:signal transduction histidine kinase